MEKKVRITWVKGSPQSLHRHRRTLKALGFTKVHSTVEHVLTPPVAGMIKQVEYLLKVEEISE